MYRLLIVLSVMGCFSMSAASGVGGTAAPGLEDMPPEVLQNILWHLDRDALDSLASSSNLLKRVVEEYKHNMMVKQIAYLKQHLSTKNIDNGFTIQLPCLQAIDVALKAKDDATSPWVFKSNDLKSLAIKGLQESSPGIFLAHAQYQDLITGEYVKHNLADILLETMETEGLLTATESEAVVDKDLIRIALHHQYAGYNMYSITDNPNTLMVIKDSFRNNNGEKEGLSKLITCITESYSWVHNTDRLTTFKVIKESAIHHKLEAMTAYFDTHQATTLVVDIDRVDASGLLTRRSCLYGHGQRAAPIDNINCKSISITNSQQHFIHMGAFFLGRCRLTSIDLSGLQSLETIAGLSMARCPNLTSIDLSGLVSLKSIGAHFLFQADSLSNISFFGLQNVETIDRAFIAECPNLTSIDLSGLVSVKSIGNHFLFKCGLKKISFAGLERLESFGSQCI